MARTLEQVATMIEQMHILIDIITASNVFPLHLHYLEHVSIHYSIIHSRATKERVAYFYIYMPSCPPIYMHTWKALISTGNKQLVNICPLEKKSPITLLRLLSHKRIIAHTTELKVNTMLKPNYISVICNDSNLYFINKLVRK